MAQPGRKKTQQVLSITISSLYHEKNRVSHTDTKIELVTKALKHSFTTFDTAAQPKHYREDLLGNGIRSFLASQTTIMRADLWVCSRI